MVCPRCGRSTTVSAGRCTECGAAFVQATVATGVIPNDTTGLPPGANFGASTRRTAAPAPTDNPESAATTNTAIGPLRVGQSFGPRYHIIAVLGLGGMGAVYQAWDAELSVAVALKVIRTDRRHRAPDAEKRFKQELLLARQVTHKHVVRIHDINEIDGVKYITMPFIQGHDLATVLRREGKLPLARALHFARQIADGLAAAHDAGVVHRDLKPANVMIGADDHALIMDFGISASADEATTDGIVGTLEYMAPEQGKGIAVDQRSDIYAFGLILYEMLTGPRRVKATTPQERVDAMRERTSHGVAPVRQLDPSIPEPAAAIVTRCLELDAAARFQSTTDVVAALARLDEHGAIIPEPARISRRVLAAAALVVLATIGGTYIAGRRAAVPAAEHPPVSVVVADFDNKTGDPVFNGTIEAALTSGIERASFINAIGRPAKASGFDEQAARLASIRDGNNFVLAGSIEPARKGFQLTVRVVDPPADKVLNTYTETASSKEAVLAAVSSVAARVRTQLGDVSSTREETATSETFTAGSLEAVRAYNSGNQLAAQARDAEAIVQYQRAVQLDPNLGRAYSGWALSAAKLGRTDEAEQLWKKALALLDRMTERERYRILGNYYSRVVRNPEKAIENFTRLLELYPADAAGHNNLAVAYFRSLNMAKALEYGGRVLKMYPRVQVYRDNYALYAMYAGDFERGAEEAKRIVAEVPTATMPYLPIAVNAALSGRFDEAKDAYTAMMKGETPGPSLGMTGLGDLAMYRGDWIESERLLKNGIAGDEAVKDTLDRAAKLNALAELYEAQGRTALAVSTAQEVLKLGKSFEFVVPAARVLAHAGRKAEAETIAGDLGNQLQPQTRAYAGIIRGEIALRDRKLIEAVDHFRAAQKLADLWLTRYLLGVAYVQAGADEALSELDTAQKRRGEGAVMFLEESPTLHYLAALPYWHARAQEKVGIAADARRNYERFLALRGGVTPPDPLAADAQKRIKN
jgi:tetratricopeptide (TPR) repeat protein/tRNA A-37 threonylcarbamoyl transferase component Bud32